MTAPAPHLRPEAQEYWSVLLALGIVLGIASGALVLWYAIGGTRPEGYVQVGNALITPPKGNGPTGALVGGIAAGIFAQPLLIAGLIGLGIDSSGLRRSVDRLTAFLSGTP